MSHGLSPSPCWTSNAIAPTEDRLPIEGEEALAAAATSASADTTANRPNVLTTRTVLLCARHDPVGRSRFRRVAPDSEPELRGSPSVFRLTLMLTLRRVRLLGCASVRQ